ncbi:SGNH/GDSL hydrolase family protein [Calothrix sp. PCC 6303]|uniref:SGNH/GDSL hydrolase family protein n=1 Tax=Calothrix sp. PCC 6303 TaxID=1170562 RepID=UPI0002A031A7|nr:SGNH/GDSL hydrolase family protein [Calothrix sp. PCC 6303]AFY99921.1 PEP motif putative anchor domain protein [Calothrix sp. PCC 6303]
MKKQLIMLGFVTLSTLMPSTAWAAKFNQMYVFGDSLADTGNFFKATGIPPEPYFKGRFSNGPVWVDYLANGFGLAANQSKNFAFGGATTGALNTTNPSLPGLEQQIQSFTSSTGAKANKNALYVIWAGANDYLGGQQTDPTKPVANLANAIASLTKVGAKNILVANLPDLGALPGTSNNSNAKGLTTLTDAHNGVLNSVLSGSQKPGLNIFSLDVNGLFKDAIAGKLGFANVTDAALDSCYPQPLNPICSDPNNFLFWDPLHPTTKTHSFIADAALKQIKNSTSVPESSTNWGMLGLALVGTGAIVKRQRQRNQVVDLISSK